METSVQHPWKPDSGPSVTLAHKAGALSALLLATVGFVIVVVWPLFAA